MILATLAESRRYCPIHPRLSDALGFLEAMPADGLEPGKHVIDGDELFAIAWEGFGKGQADVVMESHRKYLDVQYVVSGTDTIGWRSIDDCHRVREAYDAASDLALFFDQPESWCRVSQGSLAIFFPEDVHAPLATTQRLKKVVVKVALASD